MQLNNKINTLLLITIIMARKIKTMLDRRWEAHLMAVPHLIENKLEVSRTLTAVKVIVSMRVMESEATKQAEAHL